ncbi:MAG: hypothetical protein NTU97_02715, partial [Candidatus Magasanikbacteria bacterium]|nr:hypothetical protein [Candidatus Magasanikbacteria bacterium]
EVLRIAEEMRAANLAVNLPDLFTKIGAVAKPEHIYTNGFAFLPCRPTCRLGIPHGHIYFLDVLLGQVTNLVQGLAILNVLVRKRYSDVMTNGVMTPEIAVFLVQKMLEINMMRSGVEVDEYLTKTSPLYVQAKRQKELLDALAESKEEIRRLSL